jgi:hypothetical protein
MNASLRYAALVALCVGVAACAPRYPSAYGGTADSSDFRYSGSNASDGTYYNEYGNRTYDAYSGGYYTPPPPAYDRSPYDNGRTYWDPYSRSYYREYSRGSYYQPNTEPGWYDRWGRWHPPGSY